MPGRGKSKLVKAGEGWELAFWGCAGASEPHCRLAAVLDVAIARCTFKFQGAASLTMELGEHSQSL